MSRFGRECDPSGTELETVQYGNCKVEGVYCRYCWCIERKTTERAVAFGGCDVAYL